MVGEEIAWLSYADWPHARSSHGNKRPRNFRLNVAVVPRETGAHDRIRIAGSLEEEIGIAKKSESRIAVRIYRRTHVQQLLCSPIDNRALQAGALPGAQDALVHASLRIRCADARKSPLQLAYGQRARVWIALHVYGGR